MVLFLSENLMVAQSSGVNRDDKMLEQGLQAQATEVHTSFEGMGPNPDLKEQGSDVSEAALDTGDLNSNVTNQRFQYARGGYHGHGRGVPANFKGGHGMNRGQYTRTWANVAATPDRFEVKLQYFPPKLSQDKIIVEMPSVSPLAKWESSLVGYFIDKRLPYTLIKNSAFNMWKNKGLLEVQMNDNGFAFFIFENQDCYRNVLDGGPWYIGCFLLILKLWHRMMNYLKKTRRPFLYG